MSCPVCGGALVDDVRTARVAVARCRRCGHRVATHAGAATTADYHRQYDAGAFLDSLAATRRRQALALVALVRGALADADDILDFGAGRGWFLEACRAAGMRHVAGADTSADAVRGLTERGIAGALLSPDGGGLRAALAGLPFRPRVVTLLDVVEHFEPDALAPTCRALLDALAPELELVVLKVPLSDGVLYRVARLAANVGVSAPLEQLYQAGTVPPHYSYFSRRSLPALLGRLGLVLARETGLAELDPATVGDRVTALRRLPRPLGRAAGALVGTLAAAGPKDSGVFLARTRAEDAGV